MLKDRVEAPPRLTSDVSLTDSHGPTESNCGRFLNYGDYHHAQGLELQQLTCNERRGPFGRTHRNRTVAGVIVKKVL